MDPGMSNTGRNTAARTRDVATTAPASSAMASSAAPCGSAPSSIRPAMSSLTTMASSTTMPVASTSPNRIRLLRFDPLSRTTTRLPIRATGTAMPGISASRQRPRNSTSTTSTSTTASRSVAVVRSRLACTVSATSTITCMVRPGGKLLSRRVSSSITARLTSKAFAPSLWKMPTATELFPSRFRVLLP